MTREQLATETAAALAKAMATGAMESPIESSAEEVEPPELEDPDR
jgi:hypothetical protein